MLSPNKKNAILVGLALWLIIVMIAWERYSSIREHDKLGFGSVALLLLTSTAAGGFLLPVIAMLVKVKGTNLQWILFAVFFLFGIPTSLATLMLWEGGIVGWLAAITMALMIGGWLWRLLVLSN